jgi:hypothetical protein
VPQREHGQQRDEAEQRPRELSHAVLHAVLQPDADDVEIFFHPLGENNLLRRGNKGELPSAVKNKNADKRETVVPESFFHASHVTHHIPISR